MKIRFFIFAFLAWVCGVTAFAAPPYSGTIFISPGIVTSADRTAFRKLTFEGVGKRSMFDRWRNAFVKVKAFLYEVRFKGLPPVEVEVNSEFRREKKARKMALKYARVIGRLPKVLLADVKVVWIHKGVQPFGGGNNALLIHTDQGVIYEQSGILEETLVHEACHTSLDARHAAAPGWLAAQASDPEFISTYARDNPTREDVAESFLTWLAVRYRPERLAPADLTSITSAIPARLSYFDAQGFVVAPVN